jgi:tRNA (guanine-N7-)-methyltransferase
MSSEPIHPEPPPRVPCSHEWVPADYFRRATVDEIFAVAPERPWEVDLGCGDGTFLVEMAGRFPERNFLGVERLLGRVRGTCRKAREAGLDNVRVLRLETAYTVGWLLPRGTASRVHLLFPDPWPKKKHARHRLFRPDFLDEVRQLLLPGGELLFKTDHEDYAAEAREVVAAGLPGWKPAPWEEGDFFYPRTDFETQWLALGKSIHRVRLIAGFS